MQLLCIWHSLSYWLIRTVNESEKETPIQVDAGLLSATDPNPVNKEEYEYVKHLYLTPSLSALVPAIAQTERHISLSSRAKEFKPYYNHSSPFLVGSPRTDHWQNFQNL